MDRNETCTYKEIGILKAGLISFAPPILSGTENEQIPVPDILSPPLKLNICGRRFEIRRETLLKYPTSRLGKIFIGKRNSIGAKTAEASCVSLYDYFNKESQEFYFERDPDVFPVVLAYYITGILHIPRHICVDHYQQEMEYWGIPFLLDCCCQGFHQQEWEVMETVKKTNELFEIKAKRGKLKSGESMGSEINLTPETKWSKFQKQTWDLFEDHHSSRAASVISFLSSAMVIISTITLCLNTHPDIQIRNSDGSKADNPDLAVVEMVCICWFTIEYIARLVSCPNKKPFLKSILNSIDLLAILPFYIGIIIESMNGAVSHNFTDVRRFVQVLRIFRIIRIFKVARHSTGLQVLGYTVRNSGSELGLLFMLLLMGMTLFSCLVFYAEEDVPGTQFESIIAAFWWAIITMTTVGYGDMFPVTTVGKLIGSMCCISGILFIALPIPTIVSNFSAFYKDHLNKEKLNKLYDIQLSRDSVLSITASDTLLAESSVSIHHSDHANRRVSIAQIERLKHYKRRLSSISQAPHTGGLSKVHPIIEEEV